MKHNNENELNLIREITFSSPLNKWDNVIRIKKIVDQELEEGNGIDMQFLKRELKKRTSKEYKTAVSNYFDLRVAQLILLRDKFNITNSKEFIKIVRDYEEAKTKFRLNSITKFVQGLEIAEEKFRELYLVDEELKKKLPGTKIFDPPVSFNENEEDPLHRK
jgi:hypothetical protein